MKHPHAELMAQYAQDAMETDKPWERWERRLNGYINWNSIVQHPCWELGFQYRRKPKPYEPTLLDQALELEIEAAEKRAEHYGEYAWFGIISRDLARGLKDQRSPQMIEHLKAQGKL